jgi:hypothetical protein
MGEVQDLVPGSVIMQRMLVKLYGSKIVGKAAARFDNSMMTSTESCMVVCETGGRICYLCRKQPDILHVPYKGKGAFCPTCCPSCAPPPAA